MKIYFAGKISKNDWRGQIANVDEWAWPGGSMSEWMTQWDDDGKYIPEWPVLSNWVFGKHDYTGPFFIADDHGCGHGRNSHGVGADGEVACFAPPSQRKVFQLCMNAIDRSDAVFAWIDTLDAFGTYTEVGYAYAKEKQIFLAGKELLPDLWFLNQCGLNHRGGVGFTRADNPVEAAKMLFSEKPQNAYSEYLKSDHWKQIREAALQRAGQKCQLCGRKSRLEVHHNNYKCLWNEQPSDVIVLCRQCHSKHHDKPA